MRIRAFALLAALVVGVGMAGGIGTAGAAPDDERVVLLIPGQQLGSAAAAEGLYAPLRDSLRDAGYRVEYVPALGVDIRADAELIAQRVASAADASFVGIVGHSAGGLGARWYLKFLDGAATVDEYVAIGVPQYGSPGGCAQPADGGYDTCVHSSTIAELNAGPDAPGPTRYSVVQSDGEWTDGRLDGTDQCRTELPVPLANTGYDHTIEPSEPGIIRGVITALSGDCVGKVAGDPVDSFTWSETLFPGFPPPVRDALRDNLPELIPAR